MRKIKTISAESHVQWSGGRLACSAKEFRSSLDSYQRKGVAIDKQLKRIRKGHFTSDDLLNIADFYRWIHGIHVIGPGFSNPIHSLLALEFKFMNELPLEKKRRRFRLLARELGQLSFEVSGNGNSPTLAELLPKEFLYKETSNHKTFEIDPKEVTNAGGDIMYMRPNPHNMFDGAPTREEIDLMFDPHAPVEQPPGDPPGPTLNYKVEYGGDDHELFGVWWGNAYTRTRRVGYDSFGNYFSYPWVVSTLGVLLLESNLIDVLAGEAECGVFCSHLHMQAATTKLCSNCSSVSVSRKKWGILPVVFALGRITWHRAGNPGLNFRKFYCNGTYHDRDQLPCIPI